MKILNPKLFRKAFKGTALAAEGELKMKMKEKTGQMSACVLKEIQETLAWYSTKFGCSNKEWVSNVQVDK